MKKLLSFAFLGLAGMVLSSGTAHAWWPCHPCHSKCYVTVCFKQYNAFSPFCADGIAGGNINPCFEAAINWHQNCNGNSCIANGGYMGQLPATAEIINQGTIIKPATPDAAAGPSVQLAPNQNRAWAPNPIFLPTGVPSYYPAQR